MKKKSLQPPTISIPPIRTSTLLLILTTTIYIKHPIHLFIFQQTEQIWITLIINHHFHKHHRLWFLKCFSLSLLDQFLFYHLTIFQGLFSMIDWLVVLEGDATLGELAFLALWISGFKRCVWLIVCSELLGDGLVEFVYVCSLHVLSCCWACWMLVDVSIIVMSWLGAISVSRSTLLFQIVVLTKAILSSFLRLIFTHMWNSSNFQHINWF